MKESGRGFQLGTEKHCYIFEQPIVGQIGTFLLFKPPYTKTELKKLPMKTKDRIVQTSIELFNRSGIVAVTTNHIAKELNISPGNLYFHFANKEEIIRQIFRQMSKETYALWKT